MTDVLLTDDQERSLEPGDLVRYLPIWDRSVAAMVTYAGPGCIADHIVLIELLERVRGQARECLATRLADVRDLGRPFAFPLFVYDRKAGRYVNPKSPLFRLRSLDSRGDANL